MAEIKKPEAETVLLLGKECQAYRKADQSERVVMKKGDWDDVLASHGVTKEVREAVEKADDAIAADVLKFQSERLLKINKGKKEADKDFCPKSVITLGSGSGSMEFELRPIVRHTGKDIKTGEPYTTTKYGTVRATKAYKFCGEIAKEGGLLDQIEQQFAKVYGKK